MSTSRDSTSCAEDDTSRAELAAVAAVGADRTVLPRALTSPNTLAVVAVTLAGIGAFFNLYATQPILPLLEQLFHTTKAGAGRTVSAATLGVAISAPFAGALAERVGRRRIIVLSIFLLSLPTVLAATAGSLSQLVFWRFLQGVAMPGVFAVTMGYISEEWPRTRVAQVMSIYVAGTVLGGFLGRMFTGVAATHQVLPYVQPSWRVGFVIIGLCDVIFGVLLWRWLPPDSPIASDGHEPGKLLVHLRNPQLLATYAVGFNVLFSLVGTFTYITFYLADPPFNLSPAALSLIFTVYLVGLVVTPLGGVLIARVGSRAALIAAVSASACGILLTLVPHLAAVMVGLVLCSSGVFVCQSASASYIHRQAHSGGRAAASGLYVMFYYIGGSFAGIVPGLLWHLGGWKSCVALILLVQLITVSIAGSIWQGKKA
ncbi:MAG: MFS transporter [Acidobacteriota bacterium]|nr:MFS transporter [Acidobacteriota bacterium]